MEPFDRIKQTERSISIEEPICCFIDLYGVYYMVFCLAFFDTVCQPTGD